jgi:hypothetical protein
MASEIQEREPQELILWIDPHDGHDCNDGLTKNTPKKTFEALQELIPEFLDCKLVIKINPGKGNYMALATEDMCLAVKKAGPNAEILIDGGSWLNVMTDDEVKALEIGDKLHLVWWDGPLRLGTKAFDGIVQVDDVTDMDICCKVLSDCKEKGSYVSIMLQAPDGSGEEWPLNKAPGREGWFEFFHIEE